MQENSFKGVSNFLIISLLVYLLRITKNKNQEKKDKKR